MNHLEEVRRDSPVPLYYQVFQILQKEIESGKYRPGEKIPTEMELQDRFELSRATVRKALSELEQMGILIRRRSKGTIVSVTHIETWLKNISSFTNEIREQKQKLTTKILSLQQIHCPDFVGKFLQLTEHDLVHEMVRLRFVDDEPVAYEKWYAPKKILPNLSLSSFGSSGFEQSTYFILNKEFNIHITREEDTVSAIGMDAKVAKFLNQETGMPGLLRTRVSYTQERVPVTYASGVYIIKLNFVLGE